MNFCLAIRCGDLGTTICFKTSEEFTAWHFSNELDKIDFLAKHKVLEKVEISREYPGMEEYCDSLTILEAPKDKYGLLPEEIKQRLSGI